MRFGAGLRSLTEADGEDVRTTLTHLSTSVESVDKHQRLSEEESRLQPHNL